MMYLHTAIRIPKNKKQQWKTAVIPNTVKDEEKLDHLMLVDGTLMLVKCYHSGKSLSTSWKHERAVNTWLSNCTFGHLSQKIWT